MAGKHMAKSHGKRRHRRRHAMVGAAPSSGGGRISALKTAALAEKHRLTAIGAAIALGIAKRQGISLPSLPMVGPAATYGLAAWMLSRYTKNEMAAHAATGLLSVAAYQMASGTGVAGDDLMGGSADVVVGEEVLSGEF